MKRTIVLVLAFLAALFARPCPAPVFDVFTGVDDLVLDADAIVIAEVGDLCLPEDIRARIGESSWPPVMRPANSGMHDQHECRILRTLKGDLETGDALLAIRWLGPPHNFEKPGWAKSGKTLSLGPESRGTFLIFLQGDPPLETLNRVGCIFPAPDGFRIEDLDGKTPREAISWITGDVPPTEFGPSKLTPEERAKRRESRLQHSHKYDRHVCDPPVQVMENKLRKPGYDPATGRTPAPLLPVGYYPTNGIGGNADLTSPTLRLETTPNLSH